MTPNPFEIHTFTAFDYYWERVEVRRGGALITTVQTCADAPEDNSCSRLGIASALEAVLVAAGVDTTLTVHPLGDDPNDS